MAESETYGLQDVVCNRRYHFTRANGEATRNKILKYIKENKGVYFSLIMNKLNLANGDVQYNLERLVKEGKIKRIKTQNRTYYFMKEYAVEIPDTSKKILQIIQNNSGKSQKELAELLRIPAQTLISHAEKLIEEHKIEKLKNGKRVNYRVLSKSVA